MESNMFANKETVETGYQRAQEGMALMKALGASVQDSVLKIKQVNKGFVEALAEVKGADDLFDAQADYVQNCGQVAQDSVLDLTKLTHQTMARYLSQVSSLLSTNPMFLAAPAAPAQVPAQTLTAEAPEAAVVPEAVAPAPAPAPAPAAAMVAAPAVAAEVKAEVKVQEEPKPKEEPKPQAPVKKTAAKSRRATRTAAKAAGTFKDAPKQVSPIPKAALPKTAAADTIPTLKAVAEPAKAVATPVEATKPAEQAAPTASTSAMETPTASDETKA
jgi:hypothetical protein